MPVTLIQEPPLLSPCRNDVWVEYGCTNYRTGTAQLGGFFLQRVATPPVGHAITFTLPGGTTLTFTAVSGPPDDSGTQYTIGSLLALANAMNGNTTFSLHYVASLIASTQEIWINGRDPSVVLPAITITPGPYITHDAQPASDYTYAPNYSVRSRILVERDWMSNQWVLLGENDHWPDPDGHARENIAGLLLPEVGYDWPGYAQLLPMRSLAPLRRYRLQACERYGAPPSDRSAINSGIRVAWFAGQRHRDTPSQPYWEFTLGNINVPSPWLTYRGRNGRHEVSPNQQHVLAFYRNVARPVGSLVRMRATVYYTDGTSSSAWVADDSGMPWEKGEIACWPCGFNTLALYALQPSLVPYKYSLQLYFAPPAGGASSAISEEHTFHLMEEEASELHIEYVNSLGVVESVRCTGSWEQGLEVKYDEVYRQRRMEGGLMPPAATSDTRMQLASARSTIKLCTGYADEGEHLAIMDILFSPEVRLVDHANQRHLPLLHVAGTHAVSRRGAGEDEHLYALNLQFSVGDPELAWGPRHTLPMPTEPEIGGPLGPFVE